MWVVPSATAADRQHSPLHATNIQQAFIIDSTGFLSSQFLRIKKQSPFTYIARARGEQTLIHILQVIRGLLEAAEGMLIDKMGQSHFIHPPCNIIC
jgi:hypothetical protein